MPVAISSFTAVDGVDGEAFKRMVAISWLISVLGKL